MVLVPGLVLDRQVRVGVALYALAMVASFALASPMGGNVVRLGALFGELDARVLMLDAEQKLAIASQAKHLRDTLAKSDNIKILREVCKEITGNDLGVRFVIADGQAADAPVSKEEAERREQQEQPRVGEVWIDRERLVQVGECSIHLILGDLRCAAFGVTGIILWREFNRLRKILHRLRESVHPVINKAAIVVNLRVLRAQLYRPGKLGDCFFVCAGLGEFHAFVGVLSGAASRLFGLCLSHAALREAEERAGYDYIIQGMGGLMSLTGLPDGEPGGGRLVACKRAN